MPSNNNKTSGNRFEQDFANLLAEHGFWAHVMQQSKAGQPADIIAVKGKFHTLIDCKEISDTDKGFPFSRCEENQRLAMDAFTKRCGELCYFVMKLPDGEIRLVSYSRIKRLEGAGYKSITPRMMESETWNLDAWFESSEVWAEDK